jgi:class 3 adenylate cyclase
MAEASANEILVSELTRTLAVPSGFSFRDRGTHTLKGLGGAWRLFALATDT